MDTSTHSAASPVSILVIEHASYSLPWLEREGSGQLSAGQVSPDVIVLSQLASEPPTLFAARVLRRLSRLDRRAEVTRAVVACGPRLDEAALSARVRISQAVLAAAQGSPSAKMTLAAPPMGGGKLRHQLLAIAGTLLEQSPRRAIDISVQLGDLASTRRGAFTRGTDIAKKVA
ncbi:MAG TPA: hypothetical protein VJT73_07650 [Polyangiaceae bacterium]|nr:hypothetical protein [Polyangiaceae bacterium]